VAKALVLGGGGVAGIAWETALLLGLADRGVDLTGADLLVGTSAGSVVATQVATGQSLSDLHARQTEGAGTPELAVEFDTDAVGARFLEMLADRPDPEALRRRIGSYALEARTVSESERRAVIEARLPVHDWPERELRIAAVDAETGAFVAFDRRSGVGLVDAVAASCAVPGVWPPVTIGGRRYVDGGVRSIVNTDLAGGYEQVVVVAPMTVGLGGDVGQECEALRGAGASVALVAADDESLRAFGSNPLDPATRVPAAEAGLRQAVAARDRVAEVWG